MTERIVSCRRVDMKFRLLASVPFALLLATVPAQESSHGAAIRAAIEKRDCVAIVDAVNAGMAVRDPDTQFHAARLFDGLGCVDVDKKRALSLYEAAAKAGHAGAAEKLGVKHGLGEGVPQDYLLAGGLFRKANPQALKSVAEADYSVGYTMTLAHLTRERWRPSADDVEQSGISAAVMQFNPATGKLTVEFERRPLFSSHSGTPAARRTMWGSLTDAWESAQKSAPAPDKARLTATVLEARIEVEAPASDGTASRAPVTAPGGKSKY